MGQSPRKEYTSHLISLSLRRPSSIQSSIRSNPNLVFLQFDIFEKERELGDARNEIKGLRAADVLKEKAVEEITQEGFTEMAWQAIVSSPEVAKENKHQIVETEQLLKALLEQKNGLARRIFSKAGVDNTRLLEATDNFINLQPKVLSESSGSMLGRDLESLIQRARDYKKEYNDSFVSVEHLVLGYVEDRRFGKQLCKDFQISLKALKNAIEAIQGRQTVIDKDPEGKYEALEKYGKDLTAMARAGKLDPVIGRDDEIRRCIQILSRRTKNNPVLIGEPGVGKTAISEG